MEKFKTNIPVRIGLIAFVASIIIGLMMYVFYKALFSSFLLFIIVSLFSLGLGLFLAIWSGITYRRESGNVISFGHAFLAVYIVFIFQSIGNMTSLALINKVVDKDYAQKASSLLKEKMSDRFEKMNMPDDQIKETMKKMGPEKFDPPLTEQLKTLATWLGVFAVVSLIAAMFIKRNSADVIPINDTSQGTV